jgi:hypothetical protein
MASWTQVTPGSAYVQNALPSCRNQGCQAPELAALARHISDEAHKTLEMLSRKEGQMEPTKALWCEQGGHSFSEKDPDLQVLTIQGKDKEGKPMSESRTICGPCAAKTKVNLGSARNAPVTELPPGEDVKSRLCDTW